MVRSRLIAVALLGLGVALWAACAAKQQNGQECLVSDDCESSRCVQYVCVDRNASRPVATDTGVAAVDTGGAADTGAADVAAEAAAEAAVDTGSAADTGSD
jgi:hypothetical protein